MNSFYLKIAYTLLLTKQNKLNVSCLKAGYRGSVMYTDLTSKSSCFSATFCKSVLDNINEIPCDRSRDGTLPYWVPYGSTNIRQRSHQRLHPISPFWLQGTWSCVPLETSECLPSPLSHHMFRYGKLHLLLHQYHPSVCVIYTNFQQQSLKYRSYICIYIGRGSNEKFWFLREQRGTLKTTYDVVHILKSHIWFNGGFHWIRYDFLICGAHIIRGPKGVPLFP